VFGTGPGGKPHLVTREGAGGGGAGFDPARVHFNLTHSARLVGLCVSRQSPVGVDAEVKSRHTRHALMKIARRRFAEQEVRALEALPDGSEEQRVLFLQLWTLKEAFLKATGLGISSPVGLKHCCFDLSQATETLAAGTGAHGQEDQQLQAIRLRLSHGTRAPLSGKQAPPSLRAEDWQFSSGEPVPGAVASICWRVRPEEEIPSRMGSLPPPMKVKTFVADSLKSFLP